MRQRELEVCVETLQASEAAGAGGADRMELCAALGEGGVTPSLGFLRAAVREATVPVHVLIRPRGGDFVYSGAEFDAMCADLEDALAGGASGVVIGVLTAAREVDRGRMARILKLAHGRAVTFHRAFDRTENLLESLEVLADLGCSRILTSGGKPTVMEGFEMLGRLAERAAGRVRIAAGGGVRLSNAPQLLAIEGLDLHASLLPKSSEACLPTSDPLWEEDMGRRALSVDAVREMSALVHGG